MRRSDSVIGAHTASRYGETLVFKFLNILARGEDGGCARLQRSVNLKKRRRLMVRGGECILEGEFVLGVTHTI